MIDAVIKESPMVLVYVSAPSCNVCKVIKPQLKEAITRQFPELLWFDVDASVSIEWTGQQQVFSIPTVLVYFDGQEWLRKSRNFGVTEITSALERPYQIFLEQKT